MRTAAGLALLLLAGCGSHGNVDDDRGVTANQLDRLATRKVAAPDPAAMARLQPLQAQDAIGAPPGQGCEFAADGRMFLISTGGDTVGRLEGRLLHLVHSAPVGATGGFFEDRQISISIGRTDGATTPAGAARMIVTNRRLHTRSELDGIWTCDDSGREP
jgi:hypothetical protein